MKAKELAALIDEYDETKQTRLEHDRASRELKSQEVAMKQVIMDVLREEEMTAAGGQRVQVSLVQKARVMAGNWTELYDYIKENDAFDMLYRRLNDKAIRERLEDGPIPGITQEYYMDLSESRAKLK